MNPAVDLFAHLSDDLKFNPNHQQQQSRRGRPRLVAQMGEFDLSLIEEFRNRPCLYDRNSPQFKDKLYTAQQWQEISNILGYDVSILKDRMLQLRNRYNLEKRRTEQLREENPSKAIESPWPLYDNLKFLSGHIKARRRYKNMLPIGTPNMKEDSQSFADDSVNDYSALGADDSAAMEAEKDDAVSRSSAVPFPNALVTVKVEGNSSEDGESETASHDNETDANLFLDSNMTEAHSSSPVHNHRPHHQQQQQQQQQQLTPQQRMAAHTLQQHMQHQLLQQQQMQHQRLMLMRQRQQQQRYKQQQQQAHSAMMLNGHGPSNSQSKRKHQLYGGGAVSSTPQRGGSLEEPDAAAYEPLSKKRCLNTREIKYNAFGQFVSSSLMDMPPKVALELVEKFTSDIVRALTAEMENNDEQQQDTTAAAAAVAASSANNSNASVEEEQHH